MKQVIKAAFGFTRFAIVDFTFRAYSDNSELSAIFDPSGTFDPSTEEFILTLKYKAVTSSQDEVITAKLLAYFRIPNAKTLEEIPPYFYKNSIAIVYPYLRSFITTLTIQAQVKPLIMPLLNLSELEQPFKNNTSLIELPEVKAKKAPQKKAAPKKATNKK